MRIGKTIFVLFCLSLGSIALAQFSEDLDFRGYDTGTETSVEDFYTDYAKISNYMN
jgi:hypothetical protein